MLETKVKSPVRYWLAPMAAAGRLRDLANDEYGLLSRMVPVWLVK